MRDIMLRVTQLSAERKAVLTARLDGRAVERDSGAPGDARLVAYISSKTGMPVPSSADLRAFLQKKVADYMIPAAFVFLPDLPRAATGKVIREALPPAGAEDSIPEAPYVAPRTPTEDLLVAIWSEVLDLELVGVHDNFFEIGGDSILSIQIVAKARQAGLQLTPGQHFQYPTIAEQAGLVGFAVQGGGEPERAAGAAILTPIQRWFFEQPLADPHHWNQVMWLETPAGIDRDNLQEAVYEIVKRHDALRLRFVRQDGKWRSFYADDLAAAEISLIDLSADPEAEKQHLAMSEASTALQARLNLANGPIMQIAIFQTGAGHPDRLMICIHHLVVDLISWQVLLEDLEMAYAQRRHGEAVSLPPASSSFKRWADTLTRYAGSDAARQERAFWLSVAAEKTSGIPRDEAGSFTEESARMISISLSAGETQMLLQDVPSAYNTRTEDMLLTALALTLARWTNEKSVLIGVERHGREEIEAGLDVLRTVGWFTSFFPLRLRMEAGASPGDALKSVKEQLRRIPRGGLAYGILRYLFDDDEIAGKLKAAPDPEVIFNYGGRAAPPGSRDGLFRPVGVPQISRSPLNRRSCLLEINAFVDQGRLTLIWSYSADIHRRETLEHLTQQYLRALRGLIEHCLDPQSYGYTPSDFPDAEFSQEELDRFLDRLAS